MVVMRDAALVVTHGGHGTVMRALVNRVPMLVIPHGRDQNDNAVRITARGAGLSLMPDASADAVRAACARLLSEPQFRTAAEQLGDLVAAEANDSPLVQELEALAAATSAKCTAA
jgi:UDP:flavonoid glycosyltransferase YjiC (YdhE family)